MSRKEILAEINRLEFELFDTPFGPDPASRVARLEVEVRLDALRGKLADLAPIWERERWR